MKASILRSAMHKIKQFSDTKEWCACLTPCEALALLNDGGIETGNSMYTKEALKNKITKGECKPNWFYFIPSKQQLKKLT